MENQKTNSQTKLLVIEDDQYLADIYALKLKKDGFITEVANDGAVGIELAKKMIPDLILLDIMLPEMDGFDVLKALKENDSTKDIKVVLLTNLNAPEEVEKGLAMGAVDYMVKAHYVPSEIVEKVKNILSIGEASVPAGGGEDSPVVEKTEVGQ